MEDNFKLLNNVNIDLDKYEDLNIDKDKLKKKMRTQIKTKNKFKKNIAVAVSICIVGIGLCSVGVLNQSLAYNIPILGNMLQMIEDALNNNDLYDSYTDVNKSFSRNGLTVKVGKVVYSKNQIFMDLELKTDKPFKESKYAKALTYDNRKEYVDFLELNAIDWVFYINNNKIDNYGFDSPRFHYIDEYTLKGTMLIDFKSPIDKSNDYDIFKMKFNLVSNYNEDKKEYEYIEDINSTWELEFPVKSNISKTKTIRPKVTQDGITVEKVILTPTSLNLKLSSKENILYAEVKDDQGNILSGVGVGISNGNTYDGDYHLNNIGQDMNYITVLAYKENSNGSSELITEIKINLK